VRNKTSQQAGAVKPTEKRVAGARAELFIYQPAAKQPNSLRTACSNQAFCQERQRPRPRARLLGLPTSDALRVINKKQQVTAHASENNSPGQRREPVTQALDTEPVIFQARVLHQSPRARGKEGFVRTVGPMASVGTALCPSTVSAPHPAPVHTQSPLKPKLTPSRGSAGAGKPAGMAGGLAHCRVKPLGNNSARVRAQPQVAGPSWPGPSSFSVPYPDGNTAVTGEMGTGSPPSSPRNCPRCG